MTAYRKYHRNFRQRRQACLAAFEKKCFRCGVENRTLASNKDGEIYVLFLHIAHVFHHQKMAEDAYLIPLCPTCHWYFDHPRGDTPEGIADWFFIGQVARYFIEKEAKDDAAREDLESQRQLAETVVDYFTGTGTQAGSTEIPMEHLP